MSKLVLRRQEQVAPGERGKKLLEGITDSPEGYLEAFCNRRYDSLARFLLNDRMGKSRSTSVFLWRLLPYFLLLQK
jgi:hypothetical protein